MSSSISCDMDKKYSSSIRSTGIYAVGKYLAVAREPTQPA